MDTVAPLTAEVASEGAAAATSRAARRAVTPSDHARDLSIDELFFSTTDPKGIITSGNEVFVRVSGYCENDLVGAPHNIIRHPDMPRAVFWLLWDHIGAGRPIAAYVKNMAADGGYYWVMAVVTSVEGGYLSVRLKPSSDMFALVPDLYRELRLREEEVERASESRKTAIAESAARLGEFLTQAGFASYDAFMTTALRAEIASRDEALRAARRAGRSERPVGTRAGVGARRLATLERSASGVNEHLTRLFRSIDGHLALSERLESSRFLLELGDDIRLFALNAVLAAARLDGRGESLSAVADLMRVRSDRAAASICDLEDEIAEVSGVLGDLSFRTSVARLQTEMTTLFAGELAGRDADDAGSDASATGLLWSAIHALSEALREDLRRVGAMQERVARISRRFEALREDLRVLGALQMNGRVEAARLADAARFLVLFEGIGERLRAAMGGVQELARLAATATGRGEDHGVTWHLRDLAECAAAMTAAGGSAPDSRGDGGAAAPEGSEEPVAVAG
jgi:aerotaxis receptor